MSRQQVGPHRLDVARALAGGLDLDEHTRAPLDLRRVAAGTLRRERDLTIVAVEALRRVAVMRVPGVPRVDVRQRDREHPGRVRADHQLRPPQRRRQQHGVEHGVKSSFECDVLPGEQPPHDREGLLEP